MRRREFVGRLVKTLAVGLGVALAPAASAKGDDATGSTHCCPSTCDPGTTCTNGTRRYFCTGSCPACCTCLPNTGNCQDFTGGCIC